MVILRRREIAAWRITAPILRQYLFPFAKIPAYLRPERLHFVIDLPGCVVQGRTDGAAQSKLAVGLTRKRDCSRGSSAASIRQ
jgi:hypothetical protein